MANTHASTHASTHMQTHTLTHTMFPIQQKCSVWNKCKDFSPSKSDMWVIARGRDRPLAFSTDTCVYVSGRVDT